MAVLMTSNDGWVISHDFYVKEIYMNTKVDSQTTSFSLNSSLFDIRTPFVRSKRVNSDLSEMKNENYESKLVKKAHMNFCKMNAFNGNLGEDKYSNNQSARISASNFYRQLAHHRNCNFHGGNNSRDPMVSKVGDEYYLIPGESSFYCYDIAELPKHFVGKKFDFILIDPPWWNKFIRRKRKKNEAFGYDMLYDKDLTTIPVHSLLKDNGMVGVWCTNAPSHKNAVTMNLFKEWKIEYLTQWFWLKVTKFGHPICSFSESLGKQPFERIIFGIKKNLSRGIPTPKEEKVFISVPSSIHSHKPPLSELLKPYLPEQPKCLELFARYLLPKWTSYGNEVIKLQHLSLYKE